MSEDKNPDKNSKKSAEPANKDKKKEDNSLPQIDFSTFIFSLNSSVFVLFGAVEDPVTGKKVKNLPVAKQTIDILGMLEEKTKGNLTSEEENLLKNILHDLRLMYVKELKS